MSQEIIVQHSSEPAFAMRAAASMPIRSRPSTQKKSLLKMRNGAAIVCLCLVLFLTPFASCQVSVLTYHYDNARTGQNSQETLLAPSNVNAASFGRLFSHTVDGDVYSQPLYVANVSIPGRGIHNVVYVATEGDSVYAFDADNNSGGNANYLWKTSLIDQAHGAAPGATTVSVTSDLDSGCTDMVPQTGITSTPVIDPITNTMFVEAKSKENGTFIHRLHALDISTGNEKPQGPVDISLITFDPLRQLNRPGLLFSGGNIYVAFASHCDISRYEGWVFSFDAATLRWQDAFVTTAPNGDNRGGIWMSGAGPAADANGNLFVATGNGTFDGLHNFGDSILNLNGQLLLADFFAPSNQGTLNQQDLDLGSGGVLLLPDQPGSHPHLLVQAGKEGTVYLIDRDSMGGYSPCVLLIFCNDRVVQELPKVIGHNGTAANLFGMPAFWNNSVFFWGGKDALKSFSLNNGLLSGSPRATSSDIDGGRGEVPIVSANGNSNGIVWSVDTSAAGSGSAVLKAHDAASLALLYSSDWYAATDAPGGAVKFSAPIVANGKVYVGASGQLSIYGLAQRPVQTPPPHPHPPKQCGANQKCCETDSNGNCTRCISVKLSCP